MRAHRFIESARMPASAWAARPLASGAPFAVIRLRCYSSVEVGCPSFGGQRTGSGCSSRLLASLVTGLNRQLTATRVGIFGSGLHRTLAGWLLVSAMPSLPCLAAVQIQRQSRLRLALLKQPNTNRNCSNPRPRSGSVLSPGRRAKWPNPRGPRVVLRWHLTPPSRGRLAPRRKPPLTANVSRLWAPA